MKYFICILFVFVPIISFSQLSEKVNNLYLQLNSENQSKNKEFGYGVMESEDYKKCEDINKIANDIEILYMAENGNKIIKSYMSNHLVKRKSNKIIDLFKTYLYNDEEVWAQMGCTGQNSSIAGELYSYIFYENEKIENIKYNKEHYSSKEIKENGFENKTKWTKPEIDSLLVSINKLVINYDLILPITINQIFRLNDYKFENYERVKYFAYKNPTRETLATLASYQNQDDLPFLLKNNSLSFLAISKFPDASFLTLLKEKNEKEYENVDFINAISSICSKDSEILKRNLLEHFSSSHDFDAREFLDYCFEALSKYKCDFNSQLIELYKR
ncbi:hypothetical protein OX283_006810 [Flavobacterium sp. SUN052]|uniref:hypothetical protein n=1 Tax=Flavobacterium sp. SUN052 TaxID=3002441 RepID=UPI00237E61A7|nr:hypothetical protein [Flavobacterium sp. SUN052]MEC4004359.1 hypothetical protein [Flavobacterium sp. SUN052]